MLCVLGLAVHEGFTLNTVKLLLILAFVALTNPVATHALTRAAIRAGLVPWFIKDREAHSKSCPTEND
jgi:multicomponent Na+:H+ antiporter subunit G